MRLYVITLRKIKLSIRNRDIRRLLEIYEFLEPYAAKNQILLEVFSRKLGTLRITSDPLLNKLFISLIKYVV